MTIAWTCERCGAAIEGWVHRCTQHLKRALREAKGNVTAAAVILELSRSHLCRLLKERELVEFAAELRLQAGQGSRVKFGSLKGRVLGAHRKKPGGRSPD